MVDSAPNKMLSDLITAFDTYRGMQDSCEAQVRLWAALQRASPTQLPDSPSLRWPASASQAAQRFKPMVEKLGTDAVAQVAKKDGEEAALNLLKSLPALPGLFRDSMALLCCHSEMKDWTADKVTHSVSALPAHIANYHKLVSIPDALLCDLLPTASQDLPGYMAKVEAMVAAKLGTWEDETSKAKKLVEMYRPALGQHVAWVIMLFALSKLLHRWWIESHGWS